MKTIQYLESEIVAARVTEQPRYGMTVGGYTCQRGAPTCWMIRLAGEGKRWRRVYVWCWSNVGTLFVRVRGQNLVVRHEYALTEAGKKYKQEQDK